MESRLKLTVQLIDLDHGGAASVLRGETAQFLEKEVGVDIERDTAFLQEFPVRGEVW